MSAPLIIAQSVPCQLYAGPGGKLPTKLSLRATVGANGQPTIVSSQAVDANGVMATTPKLTLTETADNTGIYDVTWPAGRALDLGSISVNVCPNVLATVSERRHCAVEKGGTNTNAGLAGVSVGRFRFNTCTIAGAITAPVTGSEIHASWWVDFG